MPGKICLGVRLIRSRLVANLHGQLNWTETLLKPTFECICEGLLGRVISQGEKTTPEGDLHSALPTCHDA